jgi:hypothetical protein
MTATDNDGLVATATTSITVNNVAPAFAGFPNATRAVGESYTLAGTLIDPGSDSWTATVSWGDGSTTQQSLASRAFSLSHVYSAAGSFIVTVTLGDDDSSTSTTHTVTVVQQAAGLDAALAQVDQLVAARKISKSIGALFKAEIVAAQKLIARAKEPAAAAVLKALVLQIDLLTRCRHVKAADVAPLRATLVQVIKGLRTR